MGSLLGASEDEGQAHLRRRWRAQGAFEKFDGGGDKAQIPAAATDCCRWMELPRLSPPPPPMGPLIGPRGRSWPSAAAAAATGFPSVEQRPPFAAGCPLSSSSSPAARPNRRQPRRPMLAAAADGGLFARPSMAGLLWAGLASPLASAPSPPPVCLPFSVAVVESSHRRQAQTAAAAAGEEGR
jgi:hypothetical protein